MGKSYYPHSEYEPISGSSYLRSLIVYYSKTGNARWVAQTLAAEIGADVEEVVEVKKQPSVFGVLRGISIRWQSHETEIAPIVRSPADYDLTIIGTPVWGGKPTPAIMAYLKKTDLSEKRVAVFFTQGNKKPQGIEETKALMPNCDYEGALSIVNPLEDKESSEKQIIEWCTKLTPK